MSQKTSKNSANHNNYNNDNNNDNNANVNPHVNAQIIVTETEHLSNNTFNLSTLIP